MVGEMWDSERFLRMPGRCQIVWGTERVEAYPLVALDATMASASPAIVSFWRLYKW